MDSVLEHKIPTTSWWSTNWDNGCKPAKVGVASVVDQCSPNRVLTHLGQTFNVSSCSKVAIIFFSKKKKIYGGGEHDKFPERPFVSEVSAVAAFCVLSCGTSYGETWYSQLATCQREDV